MAPLFGDPFDMVFFVVAIVAAFQVLRLVSGGLGVTRVVPDGVPSKAYLAATREVAYRPTKRRKNSESPSAVVSDGQYPRDTPMPDEGASPEEDAYPELSVVQQSQRLESAQDSTGPWKPSGSQDSRGRPAHDESPLALLVRRPGRTLWLFLFLAVAVLAVIRGAVMWDGYDKVFVLYGAIAAAVGVRQYRIRVEANERRVLVVNLLGSYTLSWDKVEWIGTIAKDDKRALALRAPEGYIRAQATFAGLAWPAGQPVQARRLATQLHALRDVALQAPQDDGARTLHRVPSLRPWQRTALWVGVPVAALATWVWVIGSSPLRVSLENLLVGDCFRSRDLTQFDVEIVECSQPHDVQVIAEFTLHKTDYEDHDAAVDAALDMCADEFRTRIGREPTDVILVALGTWDDSLIVGYCLAEASSDVTTSLPGLIP